MLPLHSPRLFTALSCTAAFILAGCLPIADPVISKGFDALDAAYVLKVKPQDASFTKCRHAQVGTRHFVRCGISFGSTELVQVGLWEIEAASDQPVAYAMNGPALRALEKIGTQEGFKLGHGRPHPDRQALDKAFE